MRKLISCLMFVVILISICLFTQNVYAQEYNEKQIERRIRTFNRMFRTGIRLAFIGVCLDLVGVGVRSIGNTVYNRINTESGILVRNGSVVVITVGSILTLTGLPLLIAGGINAKVFEMKLSNNNTIKPVMNYCFKDRTGNIGLHYSF